jgi:hypothetical protein
LEQAICICFINISFSSGYVNCLLCLLAKKHVNLDEKLKAQRMIKDMEKKRNEMRRKLYEVQDGVDVKKVS